MLSLTLITLGVNHDPLVLLEVDRVLDGQPSQSSFIAVDDLVALEDLGRAEDVSAHGLRGSFQLESPVLDALLVEELLRHILNLLDLVLRSDSGLSESITHASAFLHFVGDSINEAEFRRKVEVLVLVLDEEKRLLGTSNDHVVMALEVLGNTDLLALEVELHGHGTEVEFNVRHNVSSTVAPVGNHALSRVLKLDHLLPVVLVLGTPLHLFNLLEAGLGGHELEDTVHAEHRAGFRLDGRGFEPIPNLEASVFEHQRLLHVEEARSFTNLLQVSTSEGLLNDNVQKLALNRLSLVNAG